MQRATALAVLERLHAAQRDFYAGGPDAPLRPVLAEDVVWTIPGANAIAGCYRGVEEVMRYFARRRDLAEGSFHMYPGEVLVGDGDHVAVLTHGSARVHGIEHRWSTVGLYRLREERIAACSLLPLDPLAFDAAWGGER